MAVTIVTGYKDGSPYPLEVCEVECGHYLRVDLVRQVQQAIQVGREHGIHISLSSAFRTIEKQTELYEGHQKDPAHFAPADRPGHSKHQQGVAIDLHLPGGRAAQEEFAALAHAYGMERPVLREPWHYVVSPQHKDAEVA